MQRATSNVPGNCLGREWLPEVVHPSNRLVGKRHCAILGAIRKISSLRPFPLPEKFWISTESKPYQEHPSRPKPVKQQSYKPNVRDVRVPRIRVALGGCWRRKASQTVDRLEDDGHRRRPRHRFTTAKAVPHLSVMFGRPLEEA